MRGVIVITLCHHCDYVVFTLLFIVLLRAICQYEGRNAAVYCCVCHGLSSRRWGGGGGGIVMGTVEYFGPTLKSQTQSNRVD